jgi:hypothetical protein
VHPTNSNSPTALSPVIDFAATDSYVLPRVAVRKGLADHDQFRTVESDDEGILRDAGGEVKSRCEGVTGD